MDFEQIKKLVDPSRVGDLEQMYIEFQVENLDDGLDHFVLHLHRLGYLDARSLAWVGDAEAVSIIPSMALSDDGLQAEPPAPREPDNLCILETVGEGGSGSVALARDLSLHRYVAYKTVHDQHRVHADVMERFDFEAQVTAQLDHPNIVPVYTYDTGQGYSMKLVAGRTLTQLIRAARDGEEANDDDLSLENMLEIFLKVCDAVHYAHSKGVVHRDLKPSNIMVGRFNEVYVVDWGIAKLMAAGHKDAPARAEAPDVEWVSLGDTGDSPLTVEGELLGTPGYLSPEQARSEHDAIGPASDTFSLGIILYEIVNLERAFRGRHMLATVKLAMNAELPPMTNRRVQGTAVGELGAIIQRACALEPADRYASAEALADDVRHFMRGQELKARPDGAVQRVVRWVGHHREATLGLLMALVLLGGGSAMASVYERQRATIAAQKVEEAVTNLVVDVGARAQDLERHFLEFEATVEGLAAAAGHLLINGGTDSEAIYLNEDYADPARAPGDFVRSRAYGREVSLDWPVFKLAPGVSAESVEEQLRQLAPIRHWFRQALFEHAGGPGWRNHEAAVRTAVVDSGATLTWAYVGLESGIHVAYPGKGRYPAEYDPRARPWYRLSAGDDGRRWLAPYVDVGGRGLVIPATRTIRSANGALVGVAGVEMTLDHVRGVLGEAVRDERIIAAYLLDERGYVAASTGDVAQRYAVGTLIANLADLEIFPDEEVVAAVRNRHSGHIKKDVEGKTHLLVFKRLASVGWYLVVEASTSG